MNSQTTDKRRRLEERYDLAEISARRAADNARAAQMRNPPAWTSAAHWDDIERRARARMAALRARIEQT